MQQGMATIRGGQSLSPLTQPEMHPLLNSMHDMLSHTVDIAQQVHLARDHSAADMLQAFGCGWCQMRQHSTTHWDECFCLLSAIQTASRNHAAPPRRQACQTPPRTRRVAAATLPGLVMPCACCPLQLCRTRGTKMQSLAALAQQRGQATFLGDGLLTLPNPACVLL